jgi:hypothetical protein
LCKDLRSAVNLSDFKQSCRAHAAADTHGCHYIFYTAPPPLKQNVPNLSRARHAVGVANRNGAAIHVVDFGIDPKMVAAIQNLASKGFVKLPKADVFDPETCILQQLWNCKERAPNPKLDTFVDWLYEQVEAEPTMRFFRA